MKPKDSGWRWFETLPTLDALQRRVNDEWAAGLAAIYHAGRPGLTVAQIRQRMDAARGQAWPRSEPVVVGMPLCRAPETHAADCECRTLEGT